VAITGRTIAGVSNRVRVVEAALREHFGAAYAGYARRTRRFLPDIIWKKRAGA
jgi:protein-S-isoprenylcysteine O-methyltransferase Ste14